jgi:phage shock protein A
LDPDQPTAAALTDLVQRYETLARWLDATIPTDHSADQVVLHRAFYEPARRQGGLPAQLTTLALRDWAMRRRGDRIDGVPLDERLYSIRGISTVSLATAEGRVSVPFAVAGYGPRWVGSAPARLMSLAGQWELHIEAGAQVTRLFQEGTMATETVLTRIGRVIAGMTHAAVDAAENAGSEAVLAQALREIDAAADEVRGELGKAMAERTRLELRRKELDRERDDLDGKIKLAVEKGRDELAEAGIARQLDIEAQIGVLDRMLADSQESIDQLGQTLAAVRASRREAESRLADLRRTTNGTTPTTASGATRVDRALDKVERAQSTVERLTGVPAGGPSDGKAIDELNDLARKHAVAERLARLKAGQT